MGRNQLEVFDFGVFPISVMSIVSLVQVEGDHHTFLEDCLRVTLNVTLPVCMQGRRASSMFIYADMVKIVKVSGMSQPFM